jgi:hypothetical protein
VTTEPITTGSGIERTVNCRASSVLPRVWRASGPGADRGTEAHAYLERIANGTAPEESLLLVDEEHRPACEAIDLPPLTDDLRMAPEVALAYNPVTDTARVLGSSLERDYSAIGADEWPLTIDLAGVANGDGQARDWKTGWQRLARTRGNWQMRGAAIAVARAFDVGRVDAQLIYLREGRPAWRDHATFDAFELAGIAAELRATHERVRADRLAFAAGGHVEPTEGSWCRYCPSWSTCPAKAALVRWALTGQDDAPIQAMDLAAALERVRQGKKALELIEKQILATIGEATAERPLLVEVSDDGTETWLGKHQKEGNDRLDAAVAVAVAAEVLAVPADQLDRFRSEVTTVTKAAIERAVKARAPRGQAARTMERIVKAARDRGGITKAATESVGLFTRRPALAAGDQ